jgi:nitrite reductase/ring-hydroxylating ferredoxin subunit
MCSWLARSSTVDSADRRKFLDNASSAAMAVGLTAGYGTFAVWAARYLFPLGDRTARMFVCEARAIAPGESRSFNSPTGIKVTVTRRADSPVGPEPSAEQFLALSSTCPHLGCRVHWEPQSNRFFCPCHNGVFDSTGKAISGPPADAGQSLPEYRLFVENGLLFIEMPVETVGQRAGQIAPDRPILQQET